MHGFKTLLALTAVFAAATSASPTERLTSALKARDNCQNYIDSCYANGCQGSFTDPNATIGQCQAGNFKVCPCEKCGGTTGSCNDNACYGVSGKCTAGPFQGCPCN